ncbi:hypothetical protein ACWKW1_27285 [Brevibacillus parabrevis]
MINQIRLYLILLTCILTACSAGIHDRTATNDNNKHSGKINYEIIEASYSNKNVKINYPQITNLSDSNKQNEINEILKTEALKILNLYNSNEDDINLEINFEKVWKGKHLLSVRYFGGEYRKNDAYPINIHYATNINIVNGTILRLKDVVNIDNTFLLKFKKGKYKPFNPKLDLEKEGVLEEVLSTFSDKDLTNYFNNADVLGEENLSYTFSYFTEDSLGISIGVPHALGDHVEFEINYKDLQNNIKAENEVWNDFLNNFLSK